MAGPDFSNVVRLGLREWAAVGLCTIVFVVSAPRVWQKNEAFEPGPDYRMPYDLSNDYWFYDRYTKVAAQTHEWIVIGDSVVWGQYVTPEQTLPHYLNALEGRPRFANLGLDGAHPIALAGLIEFHATGVRNKPVLLQLNPLWLSSPRRDLSANEEFQFNHPRLVPQFVPWLAPYKESISSRIGVIVERSVPFLGWASHLQQAFFERTDIPSWTLERPKDNPLKALRAGLPPSDSLLRHEPVPWFKHGITKQDFPWVEPASSLQWRFFKKAVDVLKARGNRVFVLLGPFNEHLLTEQSRERFHSVRAALEAELKARGVEEYSPLALASDQYGDASHPLAPGYEALARAVDASPALRCTCHQSGLKHPAVLHTDDAFRRGSDYRTVCDDDQSQTLSLSQIFEELKDFILAAAVQVSGRFVGKQKAWFIGQGACDGDALPFADREMHGPVVPAMGQPDLLDQGLRTLDTLASAERGFEHGNLHVLQRAQCAQNVKGLEDEADFMGSVPITVNLGQGSASEEDLPRSWAIEPAQQVQERALAAATRPHDCEVLVASDFERDTAQGLDRAIGIRLR